jgi:aminoglycoside phosphotransferase (APT) family kinase protein
VTVSALELLGADAGENVGAYLADGSWTSIRGARDFFLITEYAEGEPYFRDLERVVRKGHEEAFDRERTESLAAYLAEIHAFRKEAPSIYLRRTRELFGHHECILGLLDSYDPFPLDRFTSAAALRDIERRCLDWRHRLKGYTHRLCRVHGDFHPWNVLFSSPDRMTLLDRSRGEWGEAADDVSCMGINYLFFSLEACGHGRRLLRELWQRFFDRYLAISGDDEILRVIPPYFVWRALVIASPLWYPSLAVEVRRSLFGFIDRVLDLDVFDPGSVDNLVG